MPIDQEKEEYMCITMGGLRRLLSERGDSRSERQEDHSRECKSQQVEQSRRARVVLEGELYDRMLTAPKDGDEVEEHPWTPRGQEGIVKDAFAPDPQESPVLSLGLRSRMFQLIILHLFQNRLTPFPSLSAPSHYGPHPIMAREG
eukprot:760747-Hanusia_phi.AAC.3